MASHRVADAYEQAEECVRHSINYVCAPFTHFDNILDSALLAGGVELLFRGVRGFPFF